MIVPPNAPSAVLLPQLEVETNRALATMIAFNQEGAAFINRTSALFGVTRGMLETEAAAARETNRQLAEEPEREWAVNFGVQQDFAISDVVKDQLSESNDLLRQRNKMLEDEHAEKYRRLHHNVCALNA